MSEASTSVALPELDHIRRYSQRLGPGNSIVLPRTSMTEEAVLIINHQHKFIFVKTRKTAGTSIETALATMCDDHDVITALSDDDEAARRESGIRSAQNIHVPLSGYGWPEFRRLLTGERTRFYNHFPARDIKRIVPPRLWHEYFVFCVERNPFDRAISQYHWKNRKIKDKLPSMPEFFKTLSDLNMSNWSLYTKNDRVIVDHVIRYENLVDELVAVGRRLGITIDVSNIRAKSWTRTDRRDYWEVLDPESRAIIEKRCSREIEHFGYHWSKH